MELYCHKGKETGDYKYFFKNQIAVAMCGVRAEEIVKVSVHEAPNEGGSYWAYKNIEDGSFSFIFNSQIQVQMCSPDFFKSDITNKKGKIVKVKINEI